MIVLGLTGSIGMGKSSAGKMFAESGVPVISADEIVHDLYRGEAAPLVEAAFPGTTENGVVNRDRLSAILVGNPDAFRKLEAIVHPLVEKVRMRFVEDHRRSGQPLVVVDIPLLFESGAQKAVDKVVVVSCGLEEQRRRVLDRPGMTEDKLDAILARQVPDADKRAKADFVIDTSGPFNETRKQVDAVIEELLGGQRRDA
ncbi:MAG: dephospho-CoA kinase [Pseudomonadota bacterium]